MFCIALIVILNLWAPLTNGIKIHLEPGNPMVNGSVYMIVTDVTNIRSFNWYRGEAMASNQILNYITNLPPVHGDKYINNSVAFANGTLFIPNLQKDYAGIYTVQIQTISGSEQANVTLTVSDPATDQGGLSAGAIIGIVFSVLAVVLSVAGAVFYVLKKKKSNRNAI
ncbi:carcinoembryonic antigen-related cell adhesion molecule 19-like isoform X1 [Pelobates cultripes]|uniref:Carcinoembryonic antigen-related cell adhesion molecule 19-like isoform X1 n=1 Tax=Pelobates cultripes TaxID=61616 RepID=A0AAD1T581_PELCU|nr:carcinoembryonic antigen-related cell adhesion molecule 19-like isoform X1 [Pelobates cultripes]